MRKGSCLGDPERRTREWCAFHTRFEQRHVRTIHRIITGPAQTLAIAPADKSVCHTGKPRNKKAGSTW